MKRQLHNPTGGSMMPARIESSQQFSNEILEGADLQETAVLVSSLMEMLDR